MHDKNGPDSTSYLLVLPLSHLLLLQSCRQNLSFSEDNRELQVYLRAVWHPEQHV